jgi:hypothetical protein
VESAISLIEALRLVNLFDVHDVLLALRWTKRWNRLVRVWALVLDVEDLVRGTRI